MSFYPVQPRQPTADDLLNSFALDELMTPDILDQLLRRHHATFADDHIWNPVLTLWAFLWQVVSAAKSCTAAVARAIAWRLALGLLPCSANNGAYCKARLKLPELLVRDFAFLLGQQVALGVPPCWLWLGRHVKVVDGTTVTAADTPENQSEYPQQQGISPGCGMALVRIVALFHLASAACLDAHISSYSGKGSGETSLLRQMLQSLDRGDVLLGDRIYATYWLLALLQQRDCDGVFRLHAHRKRDGNTDTSRLVCGLGQQDNLFVWSKPRSRPEWMDPATYEQMPEVIAVRILWRRIEVPGFRTREVTLVTTLCNSSAGTADELFALYRQRWQVELNLRSLKTTLKMEHLPSKTPEMVRKEIWAHLAGYNLTRAAQVRAAREKGCPLWRLSFAATRDQQSALREQLTWSAPCRRAAVLRALWVAIGQVAVPDRPDRVEPRAIKRGPKNYPRLREPRSQARARALDPEAAVE